MAKSEFKFDGENFDWSSYLTSRPQYPASFYNIIFGHHKKHGKGWDHAYDVGTGVGIVALELASRFKHVTASDPSAHHISQAPSFLSSQSNAKNIEFLQCGAEDTSKLGPGTMDMFTMAEAMMYCEYDQTIASALHHLKSGGTFAAWIYEIVPHIVAQPSHFAEDIQKIIYQVFDAFMAAMVVKFSPTPAVHLWTNMDDLKFVKSEWTNVRRIHWNRHRDLGKFCTSMIEDNPVNCFVRPWEDVETHKDSCMFLRNANYKLLESYLQSLWPLGKMSDICPAEFATLEKAMSDDRRVDLAFTTSLVLATKR